MTDSNPPPTEDDYRYARYLNHRLKNNLQVITSLLRLQEKHLDGQTPAELLKTLQNRIRTIAMVYDRVEQSGTIASVDIATYLRRICDSLFSSHRAEKRGITLEFDVSPRKLDIESAVPLGQLLNELVTNSLRHAFDGGGKVTVEEVRETQGLQIRIADNGIGSPQVDLRSTPSLGLRLVGLLADQVRAKVEREECAAGTSYLVSL